MGPQSVGRPLTSSVGTETKLRAGETSSGDIKQAPVAAPYNSKVLLNLLPSYSFRDANVSRRVTYYNTLSDSDHAALRFTEYVQCLILGAISPTDFAYAAVM